MLTPFAAFFLNLFRFSALKVASRQRAVYGFSQDDFFLQPI
jgi:hypothetical protein